MDRGKGTGIFSVPPLEEIKKARTVAAEKGPSLFRSAASHLQTARGKELSSVIKDSTGTLAAVHVQTAGKSGGRVPVAKEGRNAELTRTSGTKGDGTSLRNEANFGKSVTPHASTSPSHPHVGAQTSTAASNAAGSSNSRSVNAHGRAHYRTESGRTGLDQSKQQDVLANNARVEASAATGGTQESNLVVSSTATESSSSASATTAAPAGSHCHPHAILTNPVQKNNPVMKHIRNVPWELGDIVPDFVLGRTTCALFLSVRYHSLHPDYIHTRLKQLGKQYGLRVLLVLVDVTECQKALSELAKIALLADLTLVLAWSYEEAGRYLETYKAYENKPPDLLMERVDSDSSSRVTDCLTTVKKVNKTDAATLLNTFKTMDRVITASREELTLCPGLGPQKAQRLYDLFHEPFIPSKKPKLEL